MQMTFAPDVNQQILEFYRPGLSKEQTERQSIPHRKNKPVQLKQVSKVAPQTKAILAEYKS